MEQRQQRCPSGLRVGTLTLHHVRVRCAKPRPRDTRPHLEYASVNWNPALKRDKDTLEQVQRRATRLAQGLSHLSYSDRLASLRFYNFADYE
ncbi:hypothetical protein Pcinc_024777 [Petrolisthes cinctipes]|uniref:Uncharacterized protein n=1 Tax=Petrolisthes cinctipes TaxID=88211 RepID=A0AAE1FAG3_PETCI|nr:hypothetical protein Pcinc_024777 [Petrolisthes cinctipes]